MSGKELVARVVERFLAPSPPVAPVSALPQPPAARRAPQPPQAADYLAPRAAWPLVWVCDIGGWQQDPVTTQVSFSLTHGARYASEAAAFQCSVPFAEGDLFDKRGAYIVVAFPAGSEDRVAAILAAAGRGP